MKVKTFHVIVVVVFMMTTNLWSKNFISRSRNQESFLIFAQQNLAWEKQKIERISQQYLTQLESTAAQFPDSIQLRNELGITYAYQNQFEKASEHFKWLIEKDSTNFFAINNLGNIFFLLGDLNSAQKHYLKALKYAEGKHIDGINLNLGIMYAAADMDSMAVEIFVQVIGDDSLGYKKIGDLLGIIFEDDDLTKGQDIKLKKKVTKNNVKQITAKANKKIKERRRKTKDLKGLGTKDKKKRDIVNLGRKGSQPREEIENVLYWAH